MAVELKSLTLRGYKTYRELENFEPKRLSVLIGGNGSGKSNLISFFLFLRRMMKEPGELQTAVSTAGGAQRILHDGPKITQNLSARLELQTEKGVNTYAFRLAYAANDTLIFVDETWEYLRFGSSSPTVGGKVAGHRESALKDQAYSGTDQTAYTIRSLLQKCAPYQFHDTSFTSGMRGKSSVGDGRFLRPDAFNLAAFLHGLSQGDSDARLSLKRIQDTVRQVLPFFAEFILVPENGHVLLQWRERNCDEVFAASQASDGMLRILALIALLCQPEKTMPAVLMLDEPELGLHPQAIALVAALIRKVSETCQVIVATQSVPLVDEFTIDEIVVLSRDGRETTLRRPSESEYAVWLEEYSTGELWRKNVLEGGPGR